MCVFLMLNNDRIIMIKHNSTQVQLLDSAHLCSWYEDVVGMNLGVVLWLIHIEDHIQGK